MRRPVLILIITLAVLLVIVLAIPFLVDANQFRPAIESNLTKSLRRDVKISDLKLNIWSGTVTASGLSVAEDPAFGQTSFLRAKALTLSIDLWQALISHKLNVRGIDIDSPEIALIQTPAGLWNFSSLGAASSAPTQAASSNSGNLDLSVKSLKIHGALLSLTQGTAKPEVLQNVNIEVKDFAPQSAFPFSMSAKIAGGGDIALDGKLGPIDPANAADTPMTANLKLTNLNLAASGAMPPSSGIDGVVSLDGTASFTGQTFQVTGNIKAEKLKLAPHGTAARNPLLFDVALTGDVKQHTGQMKKGDVAIGGVKASLTGTWTQPGAAPVLNMTLSAPGVPVSGLVELLPPLDIVLPSGSSLDGGTATARLTISGPASALVVSGPVSVQGTRLKGFNLSSKMEPIEKLAGLQSGSTTEVQTLSTSLRTDPEVTSLQDIHLVLPAMGELTGGGTITGNHALSFKMRAAVRATSIPFSITGTSSDPQFRPDVGQIAAEEINRRLQGTKVGGVDAGSVLQGLFGGKKKK